ncbi:transcriptional regulator GcvA [Thalassobaculum litoreum]|uniref:transcriptional regulator GcvA n=1 Tax=Thalassobaculum litoreum TaxID=420996 RepID=UPI001FDFAB1D|nr:transcriptional regulator GcvA [Thalassobaculum litoreum]
MPSLNGVKAFESAARFESFAKAAEELNVTPAAVSRLVRLLEESLGVALFERTPNRLTLTGAGQSYRAGLTPALDQIATATEQVTAAGRPKVLTVGVGPTFAIRWLIPRLADFSAVAPDVEVRLTTGGATASFGADWSCGISLGNGRWPDVKAEEMIRAELTPVCAPQLARNLLHPRDLAGVRLLHVGHAAEDWSRWLQAVGIAAPPASGLTLAYYGQALQAAADGSGVAMGIRPYIDDDLAAGRLVAPFKQSVPKGQSWYLLVRPGRETEPSFQAFRSWILRAVTVR